MTQHTRRRDAIIRDIEREKEEECGIFGFCRAVPYQCTVARFWRKNVFITAFRTGWFGGVNFYQRKEIRDILCYVKTIANGRDDLAVQRVINVPKRGIGATSIGKVTIYASANGMSFMMRCCACAACRRSARRRIRSRSLRSRSKTSGRGFRPFRSRNLSRRFWKRRDIRTDLEAGRRDRGRNTSAERGRAG